MKWIHVKDKMPAVLETVYIKREIGTGNILHWKPCKSKKQEKAEYTGNGWREEEDPKTISWLREKDTDEIKKKIDLMQWILTEILNLTKELTDKSPNRHTIKDTVAYIDFANKCMRKKPR